eukprot:gene3821-4410_t
MYYQFVDHSHEKCCTRAPIRRLVAEDQLSPILDCSVWGYKLREDCRSRSGLNISTEPPRTVSTASQTDWVVSYSEVIIWTFDPRLAYNGLVLSYGAYCFNSTIQDWSCPDYVCANKPLTQGMFNQDSGFQMVGKPHTKGTIFDEKENLFYIAEYYPTIYLVFRGTDNKMNGLEDLHFESQETFPPTGKESSKVSEGFYYAWIDTLLHPEGLRSLVVEALKDYCISPTARCESSNLFITGHSLGAAIASALDIMFTEATQYDWPNFKLVQLYTYGSPRIGNSDFVEMFNERVHDSFRFVNQQDSIPHLPLPSIQDIKLDFNVSYVHVSTEVWFDGPQISDFTLPPSRQCADTEDPDCSTGSSVPWVQFNDFTSIMLDHRSYFDFYLGDFCHDWTRTVFETPTPSIPPTSTPNITVTPSVTPNITVTPTATPTPTPTVNPLRFPIITQQITSQYSTYSNVVGRFNNSGPVDLIDPVFVSNPNIIPIGMNGLNPTNVNGIIQWRLSPAGSYTSFMPKLSHLDFSYTINSSQAMTFTRVQ